ncbi:surface antigen-like protein [Lotmaria passim]
MSLFFRRFFLVALLVAVAAVVVANAECNANCYTCKFGFCITCKNGYYLGAEGCTLCNSEHCAHCEIAGHCISCEPGYKLQYVTGSDNVTINKYGNCVNAASFAGVPIALVAAAVAVVYAAIA